MKRTSAVKASGQLGLERGEGAGLEPHAVGDRAGHAEGLGARGCGGGSGCGRRRRRRSGGRCRRGPSRSPRRRAARSARRARSRFSPAVAAPAAAAQVRRAALPHAFTINFGDRDDVELPAPRMVPEVLGADGERRRLPRPDRPDVLDPVLDVHEPEHAERERGVGHQPHGQREREDVEVGRRQRVPEVEAAHARVVGDVRAIERDILQRERQVGQLARAPSARRAGPCAAAAARRSRRPRAGRASRRRARRRGSGSSPCPPTPRSATGRRRARRCR